MIKLSGISKLPADLMTTDEYLKFLEATKE